MGIKRDIVCTICGLTACDCANAGTFVEAVHPHQRALRAAIAREVDALPPEPDHVHQDYDRSARIQDVNFADAGSGSRIITPETGSLRFGAPPATSSPSWSSMGPLVARTPSA